MSTLVAIGYSDPYKAEEVRLMLLDELKGTGGTVLRSSLAHEDEARLQRALSAARAA